jgi:hypothetical protein
MNLNLHLDYQTLYFQYGDYNCNLAVKDYKQVPIDHFLNNILTGIRYRNFNVYPLAH